MEENKIPTRADIPDSDKWDLTHLFVDVNKWNEDVEWITRTYPRIAECKGRVGGSDGAAERMGLSRTTLLSRMKKLGINSYAYA